MARTIDYKKQALVQRNGRFKVEDRVGTIGDGVLSRGSIGERAIH
ncbi:hypothetical protein [Niameybacter massiliensis]|nr:hypothetical protein [Niameybacter massiliensis]